MGMSSRDRWGCVAERQFGSVQKNRLVSMGVLQALRRIRYEK